MYFFSRPHCAEHHDPYFRRLCKRLDILRRGDMVQLRLLQVDSRWNGQGRGPTDQHRRPWRLFLHQQQLRLGHRKFRHADHITDPRGRRDRGRSAIKRANCGYQFKYQRFCHYLLCAGHHELQPRRFRGRIRRSDAVLQRRHRERHGCCCVIGSRYPALRSEIPLFNHSHVPGYELQ